jgi:sugar/nucleoside kinase (ribokinase family)
VVGAASRDLVTEDRRGWRLGGSAAYASLAAARLGVGTACLLGVDDPAFGADELGLLEAAGVDLVRVRLERGPVFENIEITGPRRQRWASKSELVPVASLPESWRGARAWLLGPVAGELADEWAAVAAAGSLLVVGWQGLLRDFTADGWVTRVAPRPSALLERADLVCASFDDLPPDYALDDVRRYTPGAAMVLTAGARGGLAVADGSRSVRYAAIAATSVVDPTGAGDVFMAALTAAWLSTGELVTPRTLRLAAAAGSCAVEGVGLEGVPTRERVAAKLRM